MPYGILAFLFVSTFFTSLISSVMGMSGGIILLSLMSFVLPMNVVIPVHGIVQLFSNGARAGLLYKHVRKDFMLPYLLGIPFGIIPSILLIQKFDNRNLPLFLVATLIMYTLFRPKSFPSWKIDSRWFFIHGVVAAFLSLFIGAIGPFLAPFFLRDDLSKEEVVSTKAAMQVLIHVIKIPSFLYLNFSYGEYWPYIVVPIVAAWVGTKYGVGLLKKLKQSLFEKLFRIILLASGLQLYGRVFFSWMGV